MFDKFTRPILHYVRCIDTFAAAVAYRLVLKTGNVFIHLNFVKY